MPQSERHETCALCGKPIGHPAWMHWDGPEKWNGEKPDPKDLFIRSYVDSELTIVHEDCASMVAVAIKERSHLPLLLMKD